MKMLHVANVMENFAQAFCMEKVLKHFISEIVILEINWIQGVLFKK